MENRAPNPKPEGFFEKKSNTIFLLFSLPAILAGLFVIVYIYLSNPFQTEPVVEVIPENNLLLVKGSIPGAKGSYVIIEK